MNKLKKTNEVVIEDEDDPDMPPLVGRYDSDSDEDEDDPDMPPLVGRCDSDSKDEDSDNESIYDEESDDEEEDSIDDLLLVPQKILWRRRVQH